MSDKIIITPMGSNGDGYLRTTNGKGHLAMENAYIVHDNPTDGWIEVAFTLIIVVAALSIGLSALARLFSFTKRRLAENHIALDRVRLDANTIRTDAKGNYGLDVRLLTVDQMNLLAMATVERAKIQVLPEFVQSLSLHHAPVTHTVTQSRTDNDLNMNGSGQLPQLVTGQPSFDLLPNSQSGMKLLPAAERLPVATDKLTVLEN